MISIENVSKEFVVAGTAKPFHRSVKKTVQAVSGVNLQAPNGRITGLLGPNGAGKTTTLRMLGALFQPDQGRITVDGIAVADQPLLALARMGILGDAHGLYPRLTARENVVYFGRLQGMDSDTALARALVHDPANIVLDEPTNGLDVLATRALREALRHLRSPQGGSKCIVFSTHIMSEVQQLCEYVVVMAQGRNVAEGTVDELLAQTGQSQFEDAFVQLAFGAQPIGVSV